MYTSRCTKPKKPKIIVFDRKDITDYIREFVFQMRQKWGRVFRMNHLGEVKNLVEAINNPVNTTFKSARDFRGGGCYWHNQKVDFVPSNLGKGFIFYFRCNGCGYRAKYLYEYSTLESPLCRVCCRLQYPAPTRKTRELSRLIHKLYLSDYAKHLLIKKAGITVEDVKNADI